MLDDKGFGVHFVGVLALCLVSGQKEKPHARTRTHTCRRNSREVCGQRLSTEGCSIVHTVEPGCEQTQRGLNESGCYTMGYTDDTANFICRKFRNTIPDFLQKAMGVIQQCDKTQLSINPQKMVTAPFTTKLVLRAYKNQPPLDKHCS